MTAGGVVAGLTDKEIAKAISDARKTGSDVFRTDGTKARGIGSLRVRARPTGQCLLYFRYGDAAGKQDSISIGVYDTSGKAGLTLRKARAKAGELSQLYQAGRRDLRAYLEHQEAQDRAARESAARDREEAERQASSGTLQALLDGYVSHLERQGKTTSARDARNLFRKNISDTDAFPHLAAMPARQITSADITGMLARLINAGTGRTAAKLRSYLRASFAAALAAPHEPTIHPALHGFHLTGNPAAAVPAKGLAQFNLARERALSATELQAFMKGVDGVTAALSRDMLWLSLLLGGQRLAQLARLRPQDVDTDEFTVTLFDRKGARKQPRAHKLPLTERAAEIVLRWLERALKGIDGDPFPYVFTNNGKVPIRGETLSNVVAEIAAAMLKAKTARAPFELRDIRRTCETMLAAMGISKDLRAQLQSHGLGGVQDRHYDRHEYMDEKRGVLEAWDAKLIEISSGAHGKNVVPLRKKS